MFHGKFENQADLLCCFQIDESDLQDCEILFAAYDGDYDCAAFVVYRHNHTLYEVNGAHCSCYGLEDQWEPEETTVEALRHRIDKGTFGYHLGGYYADFCLMLDKLSREGEQMQ
jgi:uncharacterized protein YfaT (DUF1175 family)